VALEHPTLAVAALVAATAAGVYLHLGQVFARRPAPDEANGRALRMFALWWIATGANILLGAGFIAAAAFGRTSLDLQVVYAILQRLLLAVAVAGLMHYLLFLVRGRAPMGALAAFYGAYFVFLVASLYSDQPVGVYVGDWRTDLVYAKDPSAVVGLVSFAWLVLPPVALSVAAIVVARRLPASQRAQRNRITLVGAALIAWWVVAVLAGHREAFGAEFFQVFNRLLGLSMALVILTAYKPPSWLRRSMQPPG
jgi:hypothetical protein